MRGAWVIAEKDLRGIFMRPLFYVVAGVCSLAWFLVFTVRLSQFVRDSMFPGQEKTMPIHFALFWGHFSFMNFLLLVAIAAIGVRLLTEEKRNRTYDLLLTSPVTATDITIGKLIAGVATAWALMLIGLLYPLSMAIFGSIEWGPFASSVVGFLLLTAGYVSVSLFASSITANTVLAFLFALIFNIMLLFFGSFSETTNDPLTKAIWEQVSIGNHLESFMRGSFSVAGCVFFISLVVLFTFLTQRVVESSRWS